MNYKCKDREPNETVEKVRIFLSKNKILTTENWTNDDIGLFSVNINVEGTSFSVKEPLKFFL